MRLFVINVSENKIHNFKDNQIYFFISQHRSFFLQFYWRVSLHKITENYGKSSREEEKALSDCPEFLLVKYIRHHLHQ
jgi:hypothetical protein